MRARQFPILSLFVVCISAPCPGQRSADERPRVAGDPTGEWLNHRANPYRARPVAPVSFEEAGRVRSLLRAGNLYLSLSDAIALALENNLDIEFQRFNSAAGQADLLRARGGGTLRGISYSVALPPAGIGGPATPLLNAATAGSVIGPNAVPTTFANLAALTSGQSNLSITSGTFATGPPLPVYDPAIVGQFLAQHTSTPLLTLQTPVANTLVSQAISGNLGVVQGFSPGTQVGLSFNNARQDANPVANIFKPYTTSALGVTLAQPLLRGFGMTVNRRFIRIARNGQRISDLVFQQQLIETVSGVMRLYYDMVSLTEDVRVKQQTLALAERLYEDDRVQVEQGTLAPIELVRAQAQIAAAREDLANSQGFAREQELILKTVLTRRGTADPAIRASHLIPTTATPAPLSELVQPVEDLLAAAFRNRPDLAQSGIQIDNAQISLEGSRNQLLPDLNLIGTMQNNGLAGSLNPLSLNSAGVLPGQVLVGSMGGLGTALSQVLRRNYPTYGVGLQLTLPLRNRVAQADVVRDEIQLRQTEVRRQQLENQVRLEVEDALVSLERSRAAYEAAVQARTFQEQSLAAEQEKFQVGLSTTFMIIQYQSFVAQARSTEVATRGAYAKARVALQRAIGRTLDENGISVDEAFRGQVSQPPAALP
jgi:outer membrane protein